MFKTLIYTETNCQKTQNGITILQGQMNFELLIKEKNKNKNKPC